MKIKLIIISAAVLLLLGCSDNNIIEKPYTSNVYNQCLFYNERTFYETIHKETIPSFSDVKGIICTHHLLASGMMHKLFESIEGNSYENIVIIGPDHNSKNGMDIFISKNDWLTPFGILEINEQYNSMLLSKPHVKANDTIMQNEHSSSALIPFIKYYFPNAKVNTIAIPATLNKKESIYIGNYLHEILDSSKTLLIASIDFSHYLNAAQASANDKITLDSITKMDLAKISRFNNDNLDSPQTLIAFLTYISKSDSKQLNLLENKNSYDILPINYDYTTSYFTIIYN